MFIRVVTDEGNRQVTKDIDFYKIDAIISESYRVNVGKATQLSIWVTQVLKENIIKGFAMNDSRLKQGNKAFGKDHFRELLERMRSNRISKSRIYQNIINIFAECSIYYLNLGILLCYQI